MLRFFFLFLFIQAGLFVAELVEPVQRHLVIPFTEGIAAISAWLVKLFDPNVISQGKVIRDMDSGMAVAIEAGCNGVEATIVLVAAILAFRSPWRNKIVGIMLGFLAIQLLNLIRIITLFYLVQWNRTAFEWAHLYVWQALIMLDVLIIFLIWLRYLPERPPAMEPANAA
jgi:exosortase H (IPTLxxWG-CTERM-specific)